MAPVVALAGKDHYAVVQENPLVEAPAAEAGQVIGPYHKGETVLRLLCLEGVKRADGVLRRRHMEFRVLDNHLQFRVAGDGFHGGVEAGFAKRKAVGVLEGVLRRHHKVHEVKSGLFREETDYGLMADVKGVEGPAVNCYPHRKLSTISSASL